MDVLTSAKRILRQVSPRCYLSLKYLLRTVGERLPRIRQALSTACHLATGRAWKEDYLDLWLGRRDELTPPLRKLFDGTRSYAEFTTWGEQFAQYLVARGLQAHHHVLEVGSGNGKNARALTRILRPPGRYQGFDVAADGVRWCRTHITPRFECFQFQHADIANRTYNPSGRGQACAYRFPFADRSFDFVILTSVFTHLLPADVAHYIAEIARVLRPDGRCFASFYLLNSTSLPGVLAGATAPQFPFAHAPGCRTADPGWPEDAVALDEALVRACFAREGMQIEEPITHGGWWRGQANAQDMLWAVKQ